MAWSLSKGLFVHSVWLRQAQPERTGGGICDRSQSGGLAPDFGGDSDLQLRPFHQKLHLALALPLVDVEPKGQQHSRGQGFGVDE